MSSLLKTYLSMESIDVVADQAVVFDVEIPEVAPVSEDELYEVDATLEELEEDYLTQEEELTQQEELIEEARAEMVAMEHLLEILDHGVETQQYSPQFAAVVSASMERYSELFGDQSTPSLENYSHDTLAEYYTVSQESIRGFLSRVIRVVPAAINRSADKFADWIVDKGHESKVKKAHKLADAALEKLAGKDGKVTVSLKGKEKIFGSGGKLPVDLAAAVKKDQTSMQAFAKNVASPYLNYVLEINKHIGSALQAGGPEKTSAILSSILSLKGPYAGVTQEMESGAAFIFNRHVEKKMAAPAGEKLSEKLKSVLGNSVALESGKKPDAKFGDMEFAVKEVAVLAKQAKVYVELANQIRKFYGSRINSQEIGKLYSLVQNKNQLLTAQFATWEDDKALDYALTLVVNNHSKALGCAYSSVVHLEKAGIELAKLALAISKKFKG